LTIVYCRLKYNDRVTTRRTWAILLRILPVAALVALGGCGGTGLADAAVGPVPKGTPGESSRWLSPAAACELMRRDQDVFLLCVATREEYDDGHIAGSVLVPVVGLEYCLQTNRVYPQINRGRVPRKDQTILCYCWWKPCYCPWVPTASHLAERVLPEKGFRNVFFIDGGMRAWTQARLPVERSPATAQH